MPEMVMPNHFNIQAELKNLDFAETNNAPKQLPMQQFWNGSAEGVCIVKLEQEILE
jgi:hypothetical protein